jgi:DNA-binding transcriptional ArsR family regulator
LRTLGLVKYRKEGRLAYYSLTDEHTRQLLWDVLEHLQGVTAEPFEIR